MYNITIGQIYYIDIIVNIVLFIEVVMSSHTNIKQIFNYFFLFISIKAVFDCYLV